MTLLSNPEFLRNARSQLRPGKMIASAAITALVSISVGYLVAQNHVPAAGPGGWGHELLRFALTAQALILAAGGGIACLNGIYKEKDQNSFDFQRVTRLTPLQLTLGKLFGAPVLMYFICLCLMPLAVFAAIMGKSRLSFFVAAYVVLVAASAAFHALALLISLLTVRGSHTSAIILALILLWIGSIGGPALSDRIQLGSFGPFEAPGLSAETTWDVQQIPQIIRWPGGETVIDRGMIDTLFGKRVHHVFVLVPLDLIFVFWFLLGVTRNIKRDPNYYEVYSPGQSLAFAFYLNILIVAFFKWRGASPMKAQAFLLTFNMGLFLCLGMALLRNRERTRRILRAQGGTASWFDPLWPAPILLAGTLIAGMLVVIGVSRGRDPSAEWSAGLALFRSVFFTAWLVRDFQFLQWMGLRRGKHPLVTSTLYLTIFYVCALALLSAFGCFRIADREPFAAFFVPTAVYNLGHELWALRPAMWVAAFAAQWVLAGIFVWLQQKEMAELQPAASGTVAHASA